jgi:Tol biopolymer transport system component
MDVYVMRMNGKGVRRLTEGLGNDYNPAWSLGGEQIVFYRSRDDGRDQIWVREVDGAGEWDITNDNANNIFPCFLPSGSIGFTSKKRGGSPRVVWVEADGSIRREIGPYGAYFARWSPDGGTIAFIAGDWPRAAIYIMRYDGVGVQKIVN